MTIQQITPIDPNSEGGRSAAAALTEAILTVQARIAKRRRLEAAAAEQAAPAEQAA